MRRRSPQGGPGGSSRNLDSHTHPGLSQLRQSPGPSSLDRGFQLLLRATEAQSDTRSGYFGQELEEDISTSMANVSVGASAYPLAAGPLQSCPQTIQGSGVTATGSTSLLSKFQASKIENDIEYLRTHGHAVGDHGPWTCAALGCDSEKLFRKVQELKAHYHDFHEPVECGWCHGIIKRKRDLPRHMDDAHGLDAKEYAQTDKDQKKYYRARDKKQTQEEAARKKAQAQSEAARKKKEAQDEAARKKQQSKDEATRRKQQTLDNRAQKNQQTLSDDAPSETAFQPTVPEQASDSPYHCPIRECKKPFEDVPSVIKHIEDHHPHPKGQPICWVCGRDFANPGGLKNHFRATHPERLHLMTPCKTPRPSGPAGRIQQPTGEEAVVPGAHPSEPAHRIQQPTQEDTAVSESWSHRNWLMHGAVQIQSGGAPSWRCKSRSCTMNKTLNSMKELEEHFSKRHKKGLGPKEGGYYCVYPGCKDTFKTVKVLMEHSDVKHPLVETREQHQASGFARHTTPPLDSNVRAGTPGHAESIHRPGGPSIGHPASRSASRSANASRQSTPGSNRSRHRRRRREESDSSGSGSRASTGLETHQLNA